MYIILFKWNKKLQQPEHRYFCTTAANQQDNLNLDKVYNHVSVHTNNNIVYT